MNVGGRLRRILAAEVSIAALLEVAMWLGLAHVILGIVFTFLQPDHVDLLQKQLQPYFPAGAEIVAFGVSMLLWPVLLIAPQICAA